MAEPYEHRAQTAAKHFILKRYLQTLTFKLLEGGRIELTYVDGFSGPWESRTEDFSDTSFMIALRVLKDAHGQYRGRGIKKIIRCFFVEENPEAYRKLSIAVGRFHDPEIGFFVATFQGRFEDAVSEIITFMGGSFTLVFIDPTGWTGYPYERIAPILRKSGEVLVNFMYDHINRFVASDDPKIVSSFDPILGGPGWKSRLDPKLSPGLAAEKLFRQELGKAGAFKYVVATSIDKPTADRPHFSIAYATRSPAGLRAFRQVQYDALRGYEKRRAEAKLEKKEERTGQGELFIGENVPSDQLIDAIVAKNKEVAKTWTTAHLRAVGKPIPFSDLCAAVLEAFMLRETDLKDICVELATEGVIEASWKKDSPRKRKPSDQHLIRLVH